MRLFIPLVLLSLSACADSRADYPSLLPRPIEGQSLAEPVAEALPPVPADPALNSAIAAFRARTGEVAARYAPAAADTARKVAAAKGKPEGSDAWLDAQTALAGLDQIRADMQAVVSDIDDAAISRATGNQPDYPALVTVREAAQAELDKQTAGIAAFQANLPGG